MPTQEKKRWAQLKVGLLMVSALVLLAVLIFLMTSSKGLFKSRSEIYTYLDDSAAIAVGAGEGRFDGFLADEERGSDLTVGPSARCQLGDALLGRGERQVVRRAATERAQLALRSRGPEWRPEVLEDRERLLE